MKIPVYVLAIGLHVWAFVRQLDATSWSFVGMQYLIALGAALALRIAAASRD